VLAWACVAAVWVTLTVVRAAVVVAVSARQRSA